MGLDMSIRIKKKMKRGKGSSLETPLLRLYLNKDGSEIDYDLPDLKTKKFKYNYRKIKDADHVEEVYELAYWRKANAIHKWFVDNVQAGEDDCREYKLLKSDLEALHDVVCDVLNNISLKNGKISQSYTYKKFLWFRYKKHNKVKGKVVKNRKYAEKHLPTQEGFFFGSTDYDDCYYNDLVYTKEVLEKILEKYDVDSENIYYSSSW